MSNMSNIMGILPIKYGLSRTICKKMKKSAISEILKILMLKQDIKTTELARIINVPQQTLQRVVSGVSPSPHRKTLEHIAKYFDITVKQLTGKEQLPEKLIPTISFSQDLQNRTIEIPLITWEQINNLNEEKTSQTVIVGANTNKKSFALLMNDSSMDPYFPKDSIIIIDPDQEAKDRTFVLVKLDKDNIHTFRQILIDGKHKYLKPLNPDLNQFKMRLLDETDKIVGVLTEARRIYENS